MFGLGNGFFVMTDRMIRRLIGLDGTGPPRPHRRYFYW